MQGDIVRGLPGRDPNQMGTVRLLSGTWLHALFHCPVAYSTSYAANPRCGLYLRLVRELQLWLNDEWTIALWIWAVAGSPRVST
jgi:hypothetical protein